MVLDEKLVQAPGFVSRDRADGQMFENRLFVHPGLASILLGIWAVA